MLMDEKELWSRIFPPKKGDKVKIISFSTYDWKDQKFVASKYLNHHGIVDYVSGEDCFIQFEDTRLYLHLKLKDVVRIEG